MTFDDVRRAALALPGVEDSTSYGTPALKVRRALLARLWEDGTTLVLKAGLDEKEFLIELDPRCSSEPTTITAGRSARATARRRPGAGATAHRSGLAREGGEAGGGGL